MSILPDKVLTLLAMPLGTTICVGLLAAAALALGWRRCAGGLLACAIVWLWGWSTPLVSEAVIGSLTDRYPFRRVEAMPAADAIVVLGNTKQNLAAPDYPDLVDASDRAWYAARLYLAGKAPLIIVSAGNVWGGQGRQGRHSTADATRVLLNAFGVADGAIVTESRSRNTRQNALFTAELATGRNITKVLLTTSAWHMPRAEATFGKVGLEVIPAPTDYTPAPKSTGRKYWPIGPWILRILPNVRALANSTRAFKEYLGLLVYRLRGWA